MSDLLNQASLVMVPSGYKEDTVYSVVPTDGSGDLSFTRASNGTRVNSAGLVEVCPWNLLEQSNAFSTSPWSKSAGTTLTSGQTDPNGGTTAFRMQMSSASNYLASGIFTVVSGSIYTYTIYIKSNTGSNQSFRIIDGVRGVAGGVLNGTATTQWQRVELQITPNSTSGAFQLDNAGGVYANDLLICFAQANIGTTAKPYFPTTDRLNVSRLTYQNGGGGCPSLLLEKQSTNLALYSEDFSNAVWALDGDGAGQSVTANYSVSPDGTQNADRIQLSRIGGTYSRIRQVLVAPSTGSISASIYLKTNDNTSKTLNFRLGSAGSEIITVTPNYQRFVITKSVTGGIAYDFELFIDSSTGTTIDLSAWGAQYEASSYPTSYIPTTSSSATRVADACYKTGISSLINSTEGVVFVDFVCNGFTNFGTIFSLNDGTTSNYIWLTMFSNGDLRAELFLAGSGPQTQLFYAPAVVGQRYKFAFAYKQNDFALYVDGAQIATDNSGNTFSAGTLTRADFDLTSPSSFALSPIQVNQAIIFPTRLTNAELASLTTI